MERGQTRVLILCSAVSPAPSCHILEIEHILSPFMPSKKGLTHLSIRPNIKCKVRHYITRLLTTKREETYHASDRTFFLFYFAKRVYTITKGKQGHSVITN